MKELGVADLEYPLIDRLPALRIRSPIPRVFAPLHFIDAEIGCTHAPVGFAGLPIHLRFSGRR
jgi:hypothetical protein